MTVSGRSFPTAEVDISMTNAKNINPLINVARLRRWARGMQFPHPPVHLMLKRAGSLKPGHSRSLATVRFLSRPMSAQASGRSVFAVLPI